MTAEVTLGTVVAERPTALLSHSAIGTSGTGNTGPDITSDVPELQRYLALPALRAYLAERVGIPLLPPVLAEGSSEHVGCARILRMGAEAFGPHALVAGASGSGKSSLAHLVLTMLMQAGYSVLAIEPKAESIVRLADGALQAGVPPEQVICITPHTDMDASAGLPTSLPGWNFLDTDVPLTQSVSDFVAMLTDTTTSWGPRMADILTNALIVIVAHRLSLFELVRFLVRDDYREALLRQPLPAGSTAEADWEAYDEARAFFEAEFARWSKGERIGSIGPISNKLRELLRNSAIRAMVCARTNTLHLSDLWQRQMVILVHLDRTALGDDGARLLGGLLASLLFRTAVRYGTNSPAPGVILSLDELYTLERFAGSSVLADILSIGRSYKLRLLTCAQHLDQVSASLREALLANAAIQVFFRLGHADARLVAASITTGAGERIARVALGLAQPARKDAPCARVTYAHPIRDGHGNAVRLSWAAWKNLQKCDLWNPDDTLPHLERLAAAVGIPRLYVHAPDTGVPVALRRYVKALSRADWWLDGPNPLALRVSFPKPKVTSVQQVTEAGLQDGWVRTLMDLPTQCALLRVPGRSPVVFRVADISRVSCVGERLRRYLDAAREVNAQCPEEITATLEERRNGIEQVASGGAPPQASREGSRAPGTPSPALRDTQPGRKTRPAQEPILVQTDAEEVGDDGSIA